MSLCKPRILHPRTNLPTGGISPLAVGARYGALLPRTQSPWHIAILSMGGFFSPGDVSTACAQWKIPVPPINVSTLTTPPKFTGNPNSADAENALDLQVAIAVTGGMVPIEYIIVPNSEQGAAAGLNVALGIPAVCAVSDSWGAPENEYSSSGMAGIGTQIQNLYSANIPFFSASGDSGSSDGESGGNHVDFPSSHPYSIGVGGTSLADPPLETAWTMGGGGMSAVYGTPAWQTVNTTGMRGVPDVAASADPNMGMQICLGGKWYVFGGTSAAAPTWAGWTACVCAAINGRIKNLLPQLYALNLCGPITSGSNGGFSAGPGYNEVTGLGVPTTALAWALIASSKAPTPTPPAVSSPITAAPGLPVSGKLSLYDVNGTPVNSFTLAPVASGNVYPRLFVESL